MRIRTVAGRQIRTENRTWHGFDRGDGDLNPAVGGQTDPPCVVIRPRVHAMSGNPCDPDKPSPNDPLSEKERGMFGLHWVLEIISMDYSRLERLLCTRGERERENGEDRSTSHTASPRPSHRLDGSRVPTAAAYRLPAGKRPDVEAVVIAARADQPVVHEKWPVFSAKAQGLRIGDTQGRQDTPPSE